MGVGIAAVILTFPVLVDVLGVGKNALNLAVAIAALLAFLVLLIALVRRPSIGLRVLAFAGGSVLMFIYGYSILRAEPEAVSAGSFVLNRPFIALVLLGGSVRRPLQSMALASVGFVCAGLVSVSKDFAGGVTPHFPWGPALALFVFASVHLALALVRASQMRAVPDLAKLEQDTRSAALESQFEQRAAAIIHDTVLGDLTVVMNSSGTLDDRARERLRVDVATLADPSWLRESGPAYRVALDDADLRNAVLALVTHFQWRGLSVDVADDTEHPVTISPARARTVVDAIAACLENVLQHAGTTSAELILSTTASSAMIMVVDSGVGFDVGAVPPDRLGIRASVTKRVESVGGSVRFWSRPGSGTSILLTIPYDSDVARDA